MINKKIFNFNRLSLNYTNRVQESVDILYLIVI